MSNNHNHISKLIIHQHSVRKIGIHFISCRAVTDLDNGKEGAGQ